MLARRQGHTEILSTNGASPTHFLPRLPMAMHNLSHTSDKSRLVCVYRGNIYLARRWHNFRRLALLCQLQSGFCSAYDMDFVSAFELGS